MTPEQPPHDGDVSDPMIGRLLDGRYRITARVARGGMASIYTAQDERLDRVVAIKTMHPGLAEDAAFTDRFVREARAAARLSHPHVVAVYDQGTDAGTLYLVMEYVEGNTLRDVIRERAPLRPLEALTLLKPTLQALAAAHTGGLVHRDVKPENVLISTSGQVKVADFGLARAVTADTQHTATGGVLIGTVSYLAPELVVEGRIDPRVDVYAAGVLLYEMLTGVKPHEGENPIQIAWAHVHTDVPAPSLRAPGLPDYVDALVARATARDRTLRPADASVLLRHVNRVGQALAEGVTSDAELTTDLTPLTLNPATGELVSTDTAPDPFDAADLTAIREPREVPDLPADLAAALRPGPPKDGPGVDQTRRLPLSGPQENDHTTAWDATTRLEGAPALPAHGPTHTTVVPRDGVPLAADPGQVPTTRRERKAQAKAAAAQATAPAPARTAARDTPPRRPRRRWRGAVALLLCLVLAVGVGTGAWWYGWARYTDTPGVVGLSGTEATDKIEAAGLTVRSGTPAFSERVPKDAVISTDPSPGERVLKDGTVVVHLSKGPERYQVPNVLGVDQVEAEDQLRANNLEIADITQAWSETVGTGLVISTDPVAGTELRRGDKVGLVLSKGRRPWPVTDWTGKSAAKAEAKLDKRFTVRVTRAWSDTVREGDVISQSPASGTLFSDDTVALVVSRGPEIIDLPNVVGESLSSATATLERLGFRVDPQHNTPYFGLDRVYSQSPGPFSSARKGTTVTLKIL